MQKFIISLGGSVAVPDKVDTDYLKKFRDLIKQNLKDKKFYIVVGGGNVCREYQNAAREVNPEVSDTDLDWLGIQVTKANAQLVRVIFGELAYKDIFRNPNKIEEVKESIYVGGGWEPGCSTDYDTVLIANKTGSDTLINLSNISQVYDKDPKTNPEAKPFEKMSWSELRAIVGDKWIPGANVPFDPIAAKLAEESGLKVVMMNGRDLDNLQNFLNGKDFVGTEII